MRDHHDHPFAPRRRGRALGASVLLALAAVAGVTVAAPPSGAVVEDEVTAIASAKEDPAMMDAAFAEVAKALPAKRSVSMRVLRQGRASFITFKLAE